MSAPSGAQRANHFVVILLALQRLSYFVPTLLTLGSGAMRSTGLNTMLVATTIVGNVGLFWYTSRVRWFPQWSAWIDAGWATMLTVVVSANSGPRYEDSSVNWSGRLAQAAAALSGAAITRIALAAVAVGLLMVAQVVASAVGGGRGLVDAFRTLHDTVLATLTAIGRGGLDHTRQDVRERCARDADLVRRLMMRDSAAASGSLADRLDTVVADAEALGLRVNYRLDGAPPITDDVADAIAGATREALNNVLSHAGARTAWLTVTTTDGVLTVRVVDRGIGFAVDHLCPGDAKGMIVEAPVALVTGASSGIGRATVNALAAGGHRVAGTARRAERLAQLGVQLARHGHELLELPLDMAEPDAAATAVARTVERWGRLDVLVAAAGHGRGYGDVVTAVTGHWRDQIAVNLAAAMLLTASAMPHLLRTRGHVVLVGSVFGQAGAPGYAAYAATKHGLAGSARSIQREASAADVRVTLINPGSTNTEFSAATVGDPDPAMLDESLWPFRPLAAEDVAAAVVWVLAQPGHVMVEEITLRSTGDR